MKESFAGNSWQVDVAVVGGGAAGAAAALALCDQGTSVVVIHRDVPRPVLGEGLPPRAAPVLRDLGLWEGFSGGGHRPAHGNRSVWGADTPVETDFIRSAHGSGWHLDRYRFDRILLETLRARDVRIVPEARVLAYGRGAGRRWLLVLSSGSVRHRLEADVVIDATGRSHRIARLLGAGRVFHDRLVGMIGLLEAPAWSSYPDPDSFTEIEAVPDGWWFTSLLPDGRRVAGYMTDSDGASRKAAASREGWQNLLNQTLLLRERIEQHGYTLQGSIRCVPAGSSRLDRIAGEGWCAVGDAAAAYDPLSSQGILTALQTGQRAAHAVGSSGPGALDAYEEYVRDLYARYLAEWLTYYAAESRWPGHPFWRRRHEALRDVLADPGWQ